MLDFYVIKIKMALLRITRTVDERRLLNFTILFVGEGFLFGKSVLRHDKQKSYEFPFSNN